MHSEIHITNNSSGFSTRGSFTMRQVKCLRCYAAAWSVRCSPLNWALGKVSFYQLNRVEIEQ